MNNWLHLLFKKKSNTPLSNYIRKYPNIKLVVGSGGVPVMDGWFATDLPFLDITNANNWSDLFKPNSISCVLAEHVWEHLTSEQAESANANIFKHLKKNGRLRIAVPDGLNPDQEYLEYVKPGGYGPGADDHKILYTFHTMKQALQKAGFRVQLLEYWDDNGIFHYTDWSPEDGKVIRSKRFDPRNVDGQLRYTSLIVDAVKP